MTQVQYSVLRRDDARGLRTVLGQFVHALTAPLAPFTAYDGDRARMAASGGVQYQVHKRRAPPSPWFSKTLYAVQRTQEAKNNGSVPPDFHTWTVTPLVYWPNVLWQANFGRTGGAESVSVLRPIAHGLLYLLAPLVAQYDQVLADDIYRFQTNYAAADDRAARPLFFGQDDEAAERRFDAHLAQLLKNDEFKDFLYQTMADSLEYVIAKYETTQLPLCPRRLGSGNRHKRGESCDACERTRWTKKGMLLWVDKMRSRDFLLRASIRIHKPETFLEYKDPWYYELRYLLACNPADGVIRIPGRGTSLLVNWVKLFENAKAYRPDSLLHKIDTYYRADSWMSGVSLRRGFEEWVNTPQALALRPKDLRDLVLEAGWEWKETLDIPYELYSYEALVRRHGVHDKRLKQIKRVDRRSLGNTETGGAKPRVWNAEWHAPNGTTYGIGVIQRHHRLKLVNYYTLPYALSQIDDTADKRKSVSVHAGTSRYWSLHAINKQAQLRDGKGYDVYPLAPAFAQWVASQDSVLTAQVFKQKLFTTKYPDRVAEFQREDRDYMGRFTEGEDNTILEFFLHRDKGKPTADEWVRLISQLPGRSKRSVQIRLETIAKRYVQQHGWDAYVKSALCLRNDVRRKEKWQTKGMTL